MRSVTERLRIAAGGDDCRPSVARSGWPFHPLFPQYRRGGRAAHEIDKSLGRLGILCRGAHRAGIGGEILDFGRQRPDQQ